MQVNEWEMLVGNVFISLALLWLPQKKGREGGGGVNEKNKTLSKHIELNSFGVWAGSFKNKNFAVASNSNKQKTTVTYIFCFSCLCVIQGMFSLVCSRLQKYYLLTVWVMLLNDSCEFSTWKTISADRLHKEQNTVASEINFFFFF